VYAHGIERTPARHIINGTAHVALLSKSGTVLAQFQVSTNFFFFKRHIVSNAAMVSTGTSAIASLQCDTSTEQLRHKMKPWNAPPRMRKPLWMANPAPLHVATWLECSGEDANLETGGQAKSLICTGATPDTLQVGDTQV